MFDAKGVLLIGVVEVGSGVHGVMQTCRFVFEEEVALSERFFCALFLTILFTQLILHALYRLIRTLFIFLLDGKARSVGNSFSQDVQLCFLV